jgi:hypothetical protein
MDKLPKTFFFCHACGKISFTKEGFDSKNNKFVGEKGWDISCMLNCSEIMTSTVIVPEYINRLKALAERVGL